MSIVFFIGISDWLLLNQRAAVLERGEEMKFQRIQDLREDADLSRKQIGGILHIVNAV